MLDFWGVKLEFGKQELFFVGEFWAPPGLINPGFFADFPVGSRVGDFQHLGYSELYGELRLTSPQPDGFSVILGSEWRKNEWRIIWF